MGPALALDYSSQAGDGPEGIGWALTGLPAITRCPRTIAQDGVHGSVNFDWNDRFCLGAERLVLMSGTYGHDGSEYRTEIESYSRIIAHGTAGNGPAWFDVHTKAGQVIELGNTPDSRVLPVKAIGTGTTPTARAWTVDKISDTKKNYLTVSYINDAINGQTYPLSIHYTANDGAGMAAYNSVQFVYGSRTDVTPYYQAGSVTRTTVLLSDIETFAGANEVLDYKLVYRPAGSGATHDELISVTQCDGGSTQRCLPSLTFGWKGSRDTLTSNLVPQSFAHWSESTAFPTDGPSILPGDYNGDGLTDALVEVPYVYAGLGGTPCPPPQGGPFYLGTASGVSFVPTSYNVTDTTLSQPPQPFCPAKVTQPYPLAVFTPQTTSFTGSGLTDLFVPAFGSDGHWAAVVNVGGAFIVKSKFNGTSPLVADFSGDELADIVSAVPVGSGSGSEWFSNGDGTFKSGTLPASTGGYLGMTDADGDGCIDVVGAGLPTTLYITYYCNPAVGLSTTTGVTIDVTLGPPPDYGDDVQMPITGDFNGDGKADFIDLSGVLYLSTGSGLVAAGQTPMSRPSNFNTFVGDFNGDGKADLVVNDGTQLLIYLSTGTGFVLKQTVPLSPSDIASTWPVIADWNNDGAQDIWVQKPTGDEEVLFQYTPELMTSVSNGLGATTSVTYGRLNDPSVYTKGSGATYPLQDSIGAQYVVSSTADSDGVGGSYIKNYSYAGGKLDLSGRGFLGFSQVTVADPKLHTTETTNYRMDFPFVGAISAQTKIFTPSNGSGSITLTSVAYSYQTDPACGGVTQTAAPYTVELCTTVAQSTDTNGTAFPTVTTGYTYDAYGNTLTTAALISDGSSKVTTNTYDNDTTNWLLGRVRTSNVQSVVGGSNLTRHSSYSYDPTSGLMITEIVEPNDTGTLRLETDYTYDAFGNKHISTTTGLAAVLPGIAQSPPVLTSQARSTTATYDSRGQFSTTLTNALSESETWSYNSDFGTPATHTGPNGAATSWQYDSFGRMTKETRANGTITSYTYSYCAGVNGGAASCPSLAAYQVQSNSYAPDGVTQNGPTTIAYYDILSRQIASDTQSFDTGASQWIRSETHYDAFGHAAQVSRPYFLGHDSPVYALSSFVLATATDTVDIDPLGRTWSVTAPDLSVTTMKYDALLSTVTNALGATTKTTKNAQGLVSLLTDANAQNTAYTYDAFGNMITANPPGAANVHFTYDLRGRKLSTSDQDMGTWSYAVDAFGSLYQQIDAKGQAVTMAYDALGRMVSRTEPDMTATWIYGTTVSHHNIDKLLSVACSGPACGSSYTRSYLYDGIARQSRVTIAVNGLSYYASPTYDTVTGKIASARNFSGFVLNYGYTPRGYLSTITDAATPSLVYWTANARNASLQLTQSMAGNNVATTNGFDPLTGRMLNVCASNHTGTCDGDVANISTDFDAVGNLTDRGDTLHNVSESFGYDLLNRLTGYSVGGQVNLSRTMRYNPAGSIIEKSDVCAVSGCFAYMGSHVHALSSVVGTYEGVLNPNFIYDANGNLICVTTGAVCDSSAAKAVTWTSFNMVSTVKEGTSNVALLYDPEHARVQQTAAGGATYYFNDAGTGAMTERIIPTTGSTIWRNYIMADGRIVAERTVRSTTVTVRYFVLDHLGSTVALSNETGLLVESDAYDAWGKQRNAVTGADDTTCSIPASDFSNRGFTGHEQMPDGLCLVNMNARIYDPAIGRFMSPDDVIPDLYNGQSFDRYTYVSDNPLSYTDPTGHAQTGNDADLANLSGPATRIYYDTDSEGKIDVHGAGANDNKIAHEIGEQISHGGSSGSGIALALNGSTFGRAFTYDESKGSGPSNLMEALAASIDRENGSSGRLNGGSTQDGGQSLSFRTLSGGPRQKSWRGIWVLGEDSPNGGHVVQQVDTTETRVHPDGTTQTYPTKTKWEAWTVLPGHTNAQPTNADGYDDDYAFRDIQSSDKISVTVQGSARFYEDTTLPSVFHRDPTSNSGNLQQTTVDPHIPLDHATEPVVRKDTFVNNSE
jgi:RHS repeat-associated protein